MILDSHFHTKIRNRSLLGPIVYVIIIFYELCLFCCNAELKTEELFSVIDDNFELSFDATLGNSTPADPYPDDGLLRDAATGDPSRNKGGAVDPTTDEPVNKNKSSLSIKYYDLAFENQKNKSVVIV